MPRRLKIIAGAMPIVIVAWLCAGLYWLHELSSRWQEYEEQLGEREQALHRVQQAFGHRGVGRQLRMAASAPSDESVRYAAHQIGEMQRGLAYFANLAAHRDERFALDVLQQAARRFSHAQSLVRQPLERKLEPASLESVLKLDEDEVDSALRTLAYASQQISKRQGAVIRHDVVVVQWIFGASGIVVLLLLAGGGCLTVAWRRTTDFSRSLAESERRLKEANLRLQTIFDNTAGYFALLKPDGVVLDVNRRTLDFVGVGKDNVVGNLFWRAPWWHSGSVDGLREALAQAATGKKAGCQVEVQGSRGQTAIVDFSLVPMPDEEGGVSLLVVEGLDITEQQRTLAALADSEKLFREAMDYSSIGMALLHADGSWLRVNPELCRLLGYGEEELLRLNFRNITHPEDLELNDYHYERLLSGQADYCRFEKRYLRKTGETIWVELCGRLVLDSDGNAAFLIVQVLNIQTRKAAEQRLLALREELEQRVAERTRDLWAANATLVRSRKRMMLLKGIAEQANVANDTRELLVWVMQNFCEQAKWPAAHLWCRESHDEVLKSSGSWYLSEPDRFAPLRQLESLRFTPGVGLVGIAMEAQNPLWTDDVRESHEIIGISAMIAAGVRCVLSLPVLAHGQVVAVLQFYTNESGGSDEEMRHFVEQVAALLHIAAERKSEEAELRRLALVVQHTNNPIVLTNPVGQIEWVNPAFTRLTGYSLDEVRGKKPGNILQGPETDPETVRRISQAVRAGADIQAEILNYAKSGRKYWTAVSIGIVRDSQGKVVNLIGVQQDITDRRRIEEELRRKERELNALVDNLADAIISTDREGVVRSVNAATERMFGYQAGELIGHNFFNLVPAPHREQHQNYLARHLLQHGDEGAVFSREAEGVRRDGSRIPLEITVSSYAVGEEIYFTGILHDISRRKQTIVELTQAKDAAETANRAKSAFLAAMSHEIRTPLNGVVGMIDLLGYTRLTGNQQEMTSTIKDSAFALLSIIDDILDFSKIEAGRLALETLPVSIEQVIEGVADTLAPLAEKKQTEFRMFVDPAIPEFVIADPMRLRQILFNLTGNAIKFSGIEAGRRGEVLLCATLLANDGNRVRVRFSVQDNGIGISENALERLFQPFSQAESSTTRRFGGTGLGLSICNRLTQMMGGELAVQSTEGEGSEFSVVFAFPLSNGSHYSPTAAAADLSGLEVLVPGRHPLLDQAAIYLLAADCRVVREEAGILSHVRRQPDEDAKAVVLMLDESYACASCDRVREAFSAIRSAKGWRAVTIGHGHRRGVRQTDSRTVSVDGPLLHRRVLLDAVAIAAGRARLALPDLSPTSLALPLAAPDLPPFETALSEGRVILVAEDNETNQLVIQRQLALLGYLAEVVCNGREALERWRKHRHRVILADYHMPELDGIGLAQAIRADEAGSNMHTAIIAFTANAVKGESERMLAAGMDDFISKPVLLPRLAEVLQNWMPSDQPTRASVEQPDHCAQDILDVSSLTELIGDDPRSVNTFLDAFLRQTEGDIERVVKASADAPDQVATAAHRMKSSARTVGAKRLAALCEQLESAGRIADRERLRHLVEALPEAFSAVRDAIQLYAEEK